MSHSIIKPVTNYLAAAAGVIAAALWYKASAVEFDVDPANPEKRATVVFYNGDHKWDPIRTAELQAKWNKRAALAASVAAILQAATLAMPD